MRLPLPGGAHVSAIVPADADAYVLHLKEKAIYDRTLNIPFPYRRKDAKEWIGIVRRETRRLKTPINWAIRREDGLLIGGIGFHGLIPGKSHRAEIGYWLAKPYWGRGLMTAAVRAVSAYGFKRFKLARIEAHVFASNAASGRVLEKAGFRLEGVLRNHYKKDGRLGDARLYARVR